MVAEPPAMNDRPRARTAVFLQVTDGKIQSQRSYDSYLPEWR